MLDFNVSGSTEAAKLLGGFRFTVVATRWASQVEPMMLAAIQRAAPVSKGAQRRGGVRLRDSFRAQRHITPTSVNLSFSSRAKHAKFVTKGTKPHLIQPRNARVLHWADRGGSHFAHTVHHPGTKPNPFAARAVRQLRPILAQRFADEVRKAIKGR